MTLSVSGPTNTTPVITNSILKATKHTDNADSNEPTQKRCVTPVTVTYFGHNDHGKLEKVIIPSSDNKQQPLSLLTGGSDLESFEHELSSLSPGSKSVKSPSGSVKSPLQKGRNVFFSDNSVGSNPFATYLTETNPFHDYNPFNPNNPFRHEENGTSDGQSEGDSLSSSKEVGLVPFMCLQCVELYFNVLVFLLCSNKNDMCKWSKDHLCLVYHKARFTVLCATNITFGGS